MQAWNKLARSHQEESPALYMAMTSHQARLLPDNVILLQLDNTIQEDLIKDNKPALLSMLHKTLRNYAIDIRTEVIKSQEIRKVYLPRDKLQKLTDKNPEILRLQKEMGLDLLY
ncbi:MAG: hypothetical protein ACLFN2_02350 [Bacteroidales bacterium]